MQFTGHSLPVHQSMSVPWDFYLVPFRQPNPPPWFLLITAIGMCHFLPVHHFGMACLAGSKVNIQQILICRRSTWTLIKQMEKKLGGNNTRMVRVITNNSCRQHPTKQQLYSHLHPIKLSKLDEPDMKDTAGEAGTSSSMMFSYGPPHMAKQKQGNQLELIYSSSVRIRDVSLCTYLKGWKIGRSGERGSGISVLVARQDDDDFQIWNEKEHNIIIIIIIRFISCNRGPMYRETPCIKLEWNEYNVRV